MEDTLIVAMCRHPELYDTTLNTYKDRTKKERAWRKVSEEVGLSEEICRRKWKGLRDTYLKERRKETERKSGSAAGPAKEWKYYAVLSFLDPFVTPRETSSNMGRGVEEDRTAEYNTQDDAGPVEDQGSEAAAGSEIGMGERPDQSSDGSEAESQTAAASAATPTTPTVTRRTRKRTWGSERESEIERLLLEALKRPAPPPPSEDELFLKSLVPSLQRLSPQRKDLVKFQIHKLIYEASTVVLNLEPAE